MSPISDHTTKTGAGMSESRVRGQVDEPEHGDEAGHSSQEHSAATPTAVPWRTRVRRRVVTRREQDGIGQPGERGQGELREVLARIPFQAALAAFAILLIAWFSWQSPFFLSVANFRAIFVNIAVLGVFAVPLTMLLISGHLDISITSNAALSGMVFAMASQAGEGSMVLGVLAALATGLAIGALNGGLVTMIGLNAIIVTLGSLSLFRGLTKVLANGQTIRMRENLAFLGSGEVLGIPVSVVILVAVAAILGTAMHFTIFGRRLRAIGSNPQGARLAGVHVRRNVFVMFLLTGALSALAGLMLTSQLNAASSIVAEGFELTVATAVILGGASLRGGVGTISGAMLGVFILGVFNNGLIVTGVSPFWQEASQGAVLIVAVTFDQIRIRTGRTG